MRSSRALLLALPVVLAACAQVLGYDDYHARSVEAPDASVDARDTGGTFSGDAAPTTARPPPRPAGDRAPSGKGQTLWVATKRLYLGTTNALGASSVDGWRDWGFDLDSVCTSVEDSTKNVGTCRRNPEANQDVLVDGELCRDNNFGHHVIALLKVSSDGFEQRINDGLLAGGDTWVVRIDDLDDGPDDAYAPARFYRAADEKGGVKWDGSDIRKVTSDSVTDRNVEKAVVVFASGYVRNHVWISGDPSTSQIVLPFSSELNIPVQGALMTLELDTDHKNGKRATLGGAIPMMALTDALRPIAESAGFCPGSPLYTSLFRNISRFPDLVNGAPNFQDETRDCDSMSIGIGFDVEAIKPAVEVVDPPPPAPSKCGDAGT